MAWQGVEGLGKAGVAWRGESRQGMARPGMGELNTNHHKGGKMKKSAVQAEELVEEIKLRVTPPNLTIAHYGVIGTSIYAQNAFSKKGREQMKAEQELGSEAKKKRGKKKHEPKDFMACYRGAQHMSSAGWNGIPCAAFRNAMISACRLINFKMTQAKLVVWLKSDGIDVVDGSPLVRIIKGKPRYAEHHVRLETGVIDIRARALWDPGWTALVRVEFDNDMFQPQDVLNLMVRAGKQIGIGEGRNDSKKSNGMGWGFFDVVSAEKSES